MLGNKRIGLLFSAVPNNGRHVLLDEGDSTQMFYTKHITEESFHTVITGQIDPETGDRKHTFQIVGSCNGLVCLYVRHKCSGDPIYIINPATGEQLILPGICRHPTYFSGGTSGTSRNVIGGFGYCEHSDEYKVLRIHEDCMVQVFTLGDKRGWRHTGYCPYSFLCKTGLYAQGHLYWLEWCSRSQKMELQSFDLSREEFRDLSLPSYHNEGLYVEENARVGMILYGPRLCVYYTHHTVEGVRVDFWLVTEDNTWKIKKSTLLPWLEYSSPRYVPIAFGDDDKILLWKRRRLMCYHSSTGNLEEIGGDIHHQTDIVVTPHMMTHVSLMAFGGKSGGPRCSLLA